MPLYLGSKYYRRLEHEAVLELGWPAPSNLPQTGWTMAFNLGCDAALFFMLSITVMTHGWQRVRWTVYTTTVQPRSNIGNVRVAEASTRVW